MSLSPSSLSAYFARIGHDPRMCDASLETLRALMLRHTTTIPFENLDVVLGRRIALDVPALEQKIVRGGRGGYCFEQNGLFLAVLRALGFRVTPFLARVRWQVPPEITLPATHMVLSVAIDGRAWLADVGFGGIGLTAPIAFDTEDAQATPHGTHRLVRRDRRFLHQAKIGDAWSDVYLITPDEAPPIDFEVANWFTSTHPESRFKQNIFAARADRDRRLTLFNREFTIRALDGRTEKRELATPEELLAVLDEFFGLHFPPGTRFGNDDGAPWPR